MFSNLEYIGAIKYFIKYKGLQNFRALMLSTIALCDTLLQGHNRTCIVRDSNFFSLASACILCHGLLKCFATGQDKSSLYIRVFYKIGNVN